MHACDDEVEAHGVERAERVALTKAAAVAAGSGATAISRLVAANAIAAGRLATVALPLPKRRFLALRHKERYLAKAAAAFLALSSKTD